MLKSWWKVKYYGYCSLFFTVHIPWCIVHGTVHVPWIVHQALVSKKKKKKEEKTRKTWKCWIQTAPMYRLITWKFIHTVDLGFISVQGLDWRLCYKFVISYLWVSEFCIEEFGWTIDVVLMYLLSIPKYWNIFSWQFAMLMDMLICKIFIFVSCIMNHSLTWLTWLMWC